MNLSFLTGSHVYGVPTSDSDIDLVVLVSEEDRTKLILCSDTGKIPCKFGVLNLILVTSEEELKAWKLAKDKCLSAKEESKEEGISRELSLKIHQEVRESTGTSLFGSKKQ